MNRRTVNGALLGVVEAAAYLMVQTDRVSAD
jgi:hypothetical protein